jgi:hypothetical protein
MDAIQILLIDDEPKNHKSLENRFRHPLESRGWQLAWEAAATPEEAREIFARPGAQLDLIVVDLLCVRADGAEGFEPFGPELIKEARERFPHSYIIALSGGDPNHWPDIFEDAQRSGANRLLRRGQFTKASREHSPDIVAGQIHEHLLNTGSRNPVTLKFDEFDPNILSLVYDVGRSTLCRLYSRILEVVSHKSTRTMRIGYITPGASGAMVCSVEAALEDSGATVHHLLKVSRDRDSLAIEAGRGADADLLVRNGLLVRPEPKEPVGPVNGWYAIASKLQRNAVPLRDWLAQPPPRAAEVENVMESLFTDGLGYLYAETAVRVDSPAELLALPPYRQRHILRAMNELLPVLTHQECCNLPAAETERVEQTIRLFVLDQRIDNVELRRLSQDTYEAQAHNDLHAANVLVYQGNRPVLIDPSRFGRSHWASDPARLAVDLLLRSVDAGVRSMFFSGFAGWRELAVALGQPAQPGEKTSGEHGPTAPTAPLAALQWLTGNLRALCPPITEEAGYHKHLWEWHTALAVSFLRALRNNEIPAPKRALGLVAAYDQLRGAAATVPR